VCGSDRKRKGSLQFKGDPFYSTRQFLKAKRNRLWGGRKKAVHLSAAEERGVNCGRRGSPGRKGLIRKGKGIIQEEQSGKCSRETNEQSSTFLVHEPSREGEGGSIDDRQGLGGI